MLDAREDFPGGISVRVAVTTTGSRAAAGGSGKKDQCAFIRAPPER
mgnify:CR=1 FL=1